MASFGKASLKQLGTLCLELQQLLLAAIEIIDYAVVEGYRGQKRQHECFLNGSSQTDWPNSKHNTKPSKAADLCPYRNGLRWEDKEAFYILGGVLKALAKQQGIQIRLGLDWDGDNDTHDQTFHDLPHVEVVN